jgi:hypothetical protein
MYRVIHSPARREPSGLSDVCRSLFFSISPASTSSVVPSGKMYSPAFPRPVLI